MFERHIENPEDEDYAEKAALALSKSSKKSNGTYDESRFSKTDDQHLFAPCRVLIENGRLTKEAKALGYKNKKDVLTRSIESESNQDKPARLIEI
jgi:hypothetical protein